MRILYLPNSYSQQRQHEKKVNIYPVLLAMQAQWYRNNGHQVFWKEIPEQYRFSWGSFMDKVIDTPEDLTFSMLPHPDRVWTKAKDYASGNYKYLPGTHIMSASGCGWGKCSFCVEKGQPYEVRPVEDVISEIEECKTLGFKEVFDDSATFPLEPWIGEFCSKLGRINNKPVFSCNARIDDYPFRLMYSVGFRMLLFGIESANQETLDKINKGVKVEDIIPTIKKASEAGLEPHIAVMFGYPWETDTEATRTLGLVHFLLRKGYAKTAQASFYTTQEGGNENHRKYIHQIYQAGWYLDFWFNKLKDIKNIYDIKYVWRGIKAALNG